jgi:hypothetical protein
MSTYSPEAASAERLAPFGAKLHYNDRYRLPDAVEKQYAGDSTTTSGRSSNKLMY